MASETTIGSNIDIVREYTERVFNQHSPDLAAKYLAPGVTWHGQTLGTIKGADSVTATLRGFIGALPDLRAAEQGNRRGRSRVIRIAVAGQGKASGGFAATGAAPISFADLASKSAPARK